MSKKEIDGWVIKGARASQAGLDEIEATDDVLYVKLDSGIPGPWLDKEIPMSVVAEAMRAAGFKVTPPTKTPPTPDCCGESEEKTQ